jgi:hypothetical protein
VYTRLVIGLYDLTQLELDGELPLINNKQRTYGNQQRRRQQYQYKILHH